MGLCAMLCVYTFVCGLEYHAHALPPSQQLLCDHLRMCLSCSTPPPPPLHPPTWDVLPVFCLHAHIAFHYCFPSCSRHIHFHHIRYSGEDILGASMDSNEALMASLRSFALEDSQHKTSGTFFPSFFHTLVSVSRFLFILLSCWNSHSSPSVVLVQQQLVRCCCWCPQQCV
jgi:hypothetical protein